MGRYREVMRCCRSVQGMLISETPRLMSRESEPSSCYLVVIYATVTLSLSVAKQGYVTSDAELLVKNC